MTSFNCQFIVTTRSPFIIGSVPSENVTLLKQKDGVFSACSIFQTYGADIEKILMDVFDVYVIRNFPHQKLLNEYWDFVNEYKYESEEALALRERLGDLIGYDSELMRVDITVRRMKFQKAKNIK